MATASAWKQERDTLANVLTSTVAYYGINSPEYSYVLDLYVRTVQEHEWAVANPERLVSDG